MAKGESPLIVGAKVFIVECRGPEWGYPIGVYASRKQAEAVQKARREKAKTSGLAIERLSDYVVSVHRVQP